jgi:arsenate reductase-like glutaredoxin family protein
MACDEIDVEVRAPSAHTRTTGALVEIAESTQDETEELVAKAVKQIRRLQACPGRRVVVGGSGTS